MEEGFWGSFVSSPNGVWGKAPASLTFPYLLLAKLPPVLANTYKWRIIYGYFMNAYVDVNFTCNGNTNAFLYALINIHLSTRSRVKTGTKH